ncbi:type I-F CRISPR-associated protein Csy1 [Gammaproteobacteria bacterium]|nr:type I-F CRISPR-associated protein Csy1 [Gammaproteobacteria bacterium]
MINDEISQRLANEVVAFIDGRRDDKEEKFLKEIIKPLLVMVKTHSQEAEIIKTIEKSKKAKTQTSLDFLQVKYQNLISLITDIDTDINLDVDVNVDVDEDFLKLKKLKESYQQFIIDNNNEHQPVTWLDQYAIKAKDISFATHVAKLTHSSSKSSSILDVSVKESENYLTSNCLNDPLFDTASSNAASLPIASILKLTVEGISILDCLKNDDNSLFKHLTDNEDVIEKWCGYLKQSYDNSQKQSCFLAKQIYFPTKEGQYHLLLPLVSSSLVHVLHLEHKKYWDDNQVVQARKQKSANKYSAVNICVYPNKAYIHVTGSNHSNASSLNGVRGGRIALLPTMPPQWRYRLSSYINKTSIFDKTLAFQLKEEIEELKDYLLLLKNKSLSITEPKRNEAVRRKLQAISSQFFNYVDAVNNHESMEGWTVDSTLSREQQLMFEPRREDAVAKALKINQEWQKIVSKAYGRWLNRELEQKSKLALTTIHAALWADCFLLELKEIIAIQEVEL